MAGPYFSGQQPSPPCGHYYPDVLRLRDEKRDDGTYIRVTDCKYCGRDEFQLEPELLDNESVRQLDQKGLVAGLREEDIAEVRKRELARYLPDLQSDNMIDNPVQVDALITKMKTHLPIPARGTGGMVRALRHDGIRIKSRQVQIIDVFDSGDEGGIMCALKGTGDEKTALIVSLTHLRLPGNHPIAHDVRSYQITRTQRLAQG